MKILTNFLKFFKKEKWVLVKIITEVVNIDKKQQNFYFRLYESNKGNRKVDFGCTDSAVRSLRFLANQIPLYHEKIVRWEMGRYDPDIPIYDQIPEEDTVNALKGNI